jgi:hypothetical protein
MFKRVIFILLAAMPLQAEVVRVEVKSRTDVLAGKTFGAAGSFEKLTGKIYFAVNPHNSANQIVTDIDKAPGNASGNVEFSSDFYIIKPKDPSRGNGTVLYEVSNRGNKGMLAFFDFASGSTDPQNASDFGDGFLLEQGTLLWVGWQFDVLNRDGALRTYVPVARESGGGPIRGIVRSDFEPVEKIVEASLADRGHMAYAAVDPRDPVNVLTVRDSANGPRRTIPRDQWDFTADGRGIRMASGFEPKKIYEIVFKSQDPPIAGLGIAGVRDTISKLKYGSIPELSIPPGTIKYAIAYGASQSARLLRQYVNDGFNETNRTGKCSTE